MQAPFDPLDAPGDFGRARGPRPPDPGRARGAPARPPSPRSLPPSLQPRNSAASRARQPAPFGSLPAQVPALGGRRRELFAHQPDLTWARSPGPPRPPTALEARTAAQRRTAAAPPAPARGGRAGGQLVSHDKPTVPLSGGAARPCAGRAGWRACKHPHHSMPYANIRHSGSGSVKATINRTRTRRHA